ncbi:MAG: CoA transferase [Chloroflexi bacterium]|nr:CoA transferase [Chloroflexota bacterium]
MTSPDNIEAPDGHMPLDGIRVLDLSRLVAGNVLSAVLADFGADVVKVERPGAGDDLRNWTEDGVDNWWQVFGRNKRSITLDLKSDRDIDRLIQLVRSAHVFIENFVPGKLEEMGLGPDVLLNANPGLVITRVSGWGQTGPFSHKPGFGTLVEAMSGYAHLNGFPDKPPALPPLATADVLAGAYGAFAVMAAIRNVEQLGGSGQVIDLSLFESMFSVVAPEAVKYADSGSVNTRMGNQAVNTAPRNIYETSDGKYVALSASMQSMFERLCRVIEMPGLIDDKRFADNESRVKNRDDLNDILATYFAAVTRDDILAIMDNTGVTVGPVLPVSELMEHPYLSGREVTQNVVQHDGSTAPIPSPVPRFSSTPGSIRRPAPKIGEHDDELPGIAGEWLD